MSLASELKDISGKPNEAKFALYEAVATRVVNKQSSPDITLLAKHRQTHHDRHNCQHESHAKFADARSDSLVLLWVPVSSQS